jgi:diguanylate cyclase (GGDEF)-like protein
MVDLDDLREINSQWGHATGDKAIVAFARSLRSSLRATDLIGRYAGGQFLIIMPDTSDMVAFQIIERIREFWTNANIEAPDSTAINLAFSGGIVECKTKACTSSKLIELSENALEEAKKGGGSKTNVVAPVVG